MDLTPEEISILDHTSTNGRFVGGGGILLGLARRGLLRDYGPQALCGGDHYLILTAAGRKALNEWKAAQPRPKVPRQRRSRQFQGWRDYCDLFGRIPFTSYLKRLKAGDEGALRTLP